MKAFLIDPYTTSVSEVDYNGDYRQIYELIDACTFDAVYLDPDLTVYVDDEGLFNHHSFFVHTRAHQPLAGKGLVLGADDEGNSISPNTTLEELQSQLSYAVNIGGRLIHV